MVQNEMIDKGVSIVVGILVVAILAANLLPTAITEIVGADTADWPAGAQALWDALPILFVLGLFLIVVFWALRQR